jgi:hypothetical protein
MKPRPNEVDKSIKIKYLKILGSPDRQLAVATTEYEMVLSGDGLQALYDASSHEFSTGWIFFGVLEGAFHRPSRGSMKSHSRRQ